MAKFIVFEGLDGCGKTTQIERLGAHLSNKGANCLVTREPTNGAIGSIARQALLGEIELSTDALALVFAADRAEHVEKVIRPSLAAGQHVLCDRFVYSNMAFQGTKLPIEAIAAYNARSFDAVDMTIFIDVPPEECNRRISASRKNVEIYDKIEIMRRVRELYSEVFRLYGNVMPVSFIDGNAPEDDVFSKILSAVSGIL